MRILWWRQAVSEAAAGQPPEQPVLLALAHAGAQYGWTWRYLEQILDAREADIGLTQPETHRDLLSYCERTSGALTLLACECLPTETDAKAQQALDQAALQVGVSLGLATLLRALRLHAAQGCTYIPAEVAATHGLQLPEVFRGTPSPALSDAVRALAFEASSHLLAARSLKQELSPAMRTVLLPASITELVLQRLQSSNYAPFEPRLSQPLGVQLQLRVGWHWICRSF